MKKILLYLIAFLTIITAQTFSTHSAVGITIGDRGTGLTIQKPIKYSNNFKFGAELRWFDAKLAEEIPFYNPYSGRYEKRDKISLILFPLFGSISYFPFEGKIANNFSPFISLKAGPVLTLDGDEFIESFSERWRNATPHWNIGGNIGIGVEFRQPGKIYYLISLSYDLLPMDGTIDSRSNYNGTVLSFSISR